MRGIPAAARFVVPPVAPGTPAGVGRSPSAVRRARPTARPATPRARVHAVGAEDARTRGRRERVGPASGLTGREPGVDESRLEGPGFAGLPRGAGVPGAPARRPREDGPLTPPEAADQGTAPGVRPRDRPGRRLPERGPRRRPAPPRTDRRRRPSVRAQRLPRPRARAEPGRRSSPTPSTRRPRPPPAPRRARPVAAMAERQADPGRELPPGAGNVRTADAYDELCGAGADGPRGALRQLGPGTGRDPRPPGAEAPGRVLARGGLTRAGAG